MHKEGVDFVIVSYCKEDYVRLCVESIKKFVDVPYTIYVVVNYLEKEKEMKIHQDLFKDSENIIVLEGCDQSSTLDKSRFPRFIQGEHTIGKIDNCRIGAGGSQGARAINIGIKKGNKKYVCVLDQDTILLDSCMKDLISKTETHMFISNRWCPANVFTHIAKEVEKWDYEKVMMEGMARQQLFFCKREIYDEIEKEKYVDKDIWTYSPWNVDYRDLGGNMTWYAKQKNRAGYCLINSYRDQFREDNGLWKEHVLDITDDYAEQAWLNEKPIFFHHGRSGFRYGMDSKWITEVEKYLGIKKTQEVTNA